MWRGLLNWLGLGVCSVFFVLYNFIVGWLCVIIFYENDSVIFVLFLKRIVLLIVVGMLIVIVLLMWLGVVMVCILCG